MILTHHGRTIEFQGDAHLGKPFIHGVPLHRRGDREKMLWADFERSVSQTSADIHVNRRARDFGGERAFTGHVHKPDSFTRAGIDVVVVGSLEPYSHSEGPMYVTLKCAITLQTVKGWLSPIIPISHKPLPDDYCIDLKPLIRLTGS